MVVFFRAQASSLEPHKEDDRQAPNIRPPTASCHLGKIKSIGYHPILSLYRAVFGITALVSEEQVNQSKTVQKNRASTILEQKPEKKKKNSAAASPRSRVGEANHKGSAAGGPLENPKISRN